MKVLTLTLLSLLFSGSAFAAEIICANEGFTPLKISLSTEGAAVKLKTLVADPNSTFSPLPGEMAVLKVDHTVKSDTWTILRSESSSSGRYMEMSLPKAAKKGVFKASFRPSEAFMTSTLTSYEMTCRLN